MNERFYKIGEVSEMLNIEQHTLRYLENNLRLKIKRDERGDRQYSDRDIDTLRLVLQLKDKGLNTTAIKMALENTEESSANAESGLQTQRQQSSLQLSEILSIASKLVEQNELLCEQNKKMEERMDRLEKKLDKRNAAKEKTIDEFLTLWKADQEGKSRSWFSRFRGK